MANETNEILEELKKIRQVLGKVAILLKGTYNNETTYKKLDVVIFNGQSYAAKTETTGNLPTDTDYWQLLAKKGEDGQSGQDGYTPVKGVDYYTDSEKAEIENNVKQALETEIPDVSNFITKDVNNLTNYTLKTNTGSLIDLEINQTTYVMTLKLKDLDGNVISTDTIDLPLESMVVSGSYDNINKKIILTLQNGTTIDIPVADLVEGLQTEITASNKLSSDLVDDTNNINKFVSTSEKNTWNNKQDTIDSSHKLLADLVDDTSATNKFVTTTDKTNWNAKYDKPSGGIPDTDLSSAVQTSLGLANTALQTHQDISGKMDKANMVVLTQLEYEALVEKDTNTFYFIVEE